MAFELQWKSVMYNDRLQRRIARYRLAFGISVIITENPTLSGGGYGVAHFSGVDMTARSFDSLLEVAAYLMERGLWPSD